MWRSVVFRICVIIGVGLASLNPSIAVGIHKKHHHTSAPWRTIMPMPASGWCALGYIDFNSVVGYPLKCLTIAM